MTLTPSIDTFQDITRLPDLVIEDNNLFDAMVNLTEMLESGMGTVWGDWETTGSSTRSTQQVFQHRRQWNCRPERSHCLQAQGVAVGFDPNSDQNVMDNFFALGGRPPWLLPAPTLLPNNANRLNYHYFPRVVSRRPLW